MSLISSKSNPQVKQIRALRQAKGRQEAGLFLVEGIRHVGEAAQAGAPIETLVYAPDLLDSQFALDLVAEQRGRGRTVLAVTPDVFQSMTEKENPAGILAAVRPRQVRLDDLHPDNFSWGLGLVSPQDPGNIGAILRTIDAVGADGLLLLEGGADPYHPQAVRASMGAIFWYPVVQAAFQEFTSWARRHAYPVFGSSAHGSVDYLSVPAYPRQAILLLGSERQGLSAEQAAACDTLLRLPMKGKVTSLNLSVAAGVLLYTMLERRAG